MRHRKRFASAGFLDAGPAPICSIVPNAPTLRRRLFLPAFACAALARARAAGAAPDDAVPDDAVRAIVTHEPRPEVIIADSDLLAVSALQALAEHGLAVPDDIGVVSFDDSALCSLVSPPLTALDRRPAELGRAAARLAVDGLAAQRVLADRRAGA